MSKSPSLIYIHGFASSSTGFKAELVQHALSQLGLDAFLKIPDLDIDPYVAIEQLTQAINSLGRPTLIGSSLGGYYATYLAEKFQLNALLINPVVLPHKLYSQVEGYNVTKRVFNTGLLENLLESTYNFTQEKIKNYIAALASLEVSPPQNKMRFKVWLKMDDELLDYQHALAWYKDCDVRLDLEGGHGFSDFAMYLPEALAWAGFDLDPL